MFTFRSVSKKVTLVGDGNSGKDALLTAYMRRKFYSESYTSTFNEYFDEVAIAATKV